ncbi:MAG: sulfatase [Thermogutta sp.]
MRFTRFVVLGILFAWTAYSWVAPGKAEETAARKLNVLFIAVDDLKPELGCYGASHIQSPHIDALAAEGILFERAYCQQAVCSPSRTSLLLGRRPDTTRVYDLQTHFRKTLPDVVTLPQYFKNHGYHVQGLSKIYHGGLDDPQSWSVPHWTPGGPGYGNPETLAALAEEAARLRRERGPASEVLERDPQTGTVLRMTAPRWRARGPAWEDPDVADDALPDGKTTSEAIRILKEIRDRPFFLAVGYLKPHLPFVAPKRFFQLYPREEIALAPNPDPPKNCPPIALTSWGELRAYQDIPAQGPLSDETARDLIRAYYASVSYVDAQVGRLMEALETFGLKDNTIVILWGDHGWHLGDHGLWCKHTNFESATRAPLILRVPGQRIPGAKTQALVEFVDIYPTLCELCGLPLPEGLEGTSMAPLLDDPERPWKTAAFSQYPRGSVMGYSMRTERFRYTEWRPREGDQPAAVELYDHQADSREDVNLADEPEFREVRRRLREQLEAGWRAAVPTTR